MAAPSAKKRNAAADTAAFAAESRAAVEETLARSGTNADAANATVDNKPRHCRSGRPPRDIPAAEREALTKELKREASRRRYVTAMAVFGRQPRAYRRAANAEEAAANRRESKKRYNAKIAEMIKTARAMMANLTLAPAAAAAPSAHAPAP